MCSIVCWLRCKDSDMINLKMEHASLLAVVKVVPDGIGALRKRVFDLSTNREAGGGQKFSGWQLMRELR